MGRFKLGIVVGILAFVLALPGCVQLAEDQPTPTPIPTPAESNKPVYEVKKGTITQTVKGLGRVAASQEAVLFFKQTGRLRRLYVDTNQKVKAGDILAELETGTLKTQIAEAKLNLDIAQLKLSQAVEKSGSGTATLATARAALDKANADYSKAVNDLDQKRAGATSADTKSAEEAVVSAQAAYDKAQQDLKLLEDGPTAEDLRNAQQEVDKARNALWAKQVDRDSTCGRGSGPSCESANAGVASAEIALTQELDSLQTLKAGPKPEDVADAERDVETAKASLDSAAAALDQLKAGAKPAEVTAAERSVDSARASVDAAKANYDQAVTSEAKGGDYDVQIQQKNVELARVSLQVLEDELDLAQIRAPFEGTIISTQGREGESINAFTEVVTVADPQTLQIALELQPADLTKVQVSQDATVVFTSFPTEILNAKVVYMPSLTASSDPQLPSTQRTVRLDFKPTRALELGALANVTISTEKKDDVLILPNTAIRVFGGRRFVRLQGTGRTQEVDVETGITNETETEIVKGIREGQKVIGQ